MPHQIKFDSIQLDAFLTGITGIILNAVSCMTKQYFMDNFTGWELIFSKEEGEISVSDFRIHFVSELPNLHVVSWQCK